MVEFLTQFFQQSQQTKGSKGTAVSPLAWLILIITSGIVTAAHLAASAWIITCLMILLFVVVICYVVAYFYFAVKNPDALRSEKFTLTKMAIEHSTKGDDIAGLIVDGNVKPRLSPPDGGKASGE